MKHLTSTLLALALFGAASAQLSPDQRATLEKAGASRLRDSLQYVGSFNNGFAEIAYRDGRTNYINRAGRVVVPGQSVLTMWQEDGTEARYFLFQTTGKRQGVADTLGHIVLPALFDEIYKEGHFLSARRNGKAFLYDFRFAQLAELPHAYIGRVLSDSLCLFVDYMPDRTRKTGIANFRTGSTLLQFDADVDARATGNYILVCAGRCGLLDRQGRVLLPVGSYYRIAPEESTAFIHVQEGNTFSVLDEKGKVIIPGNLYNEIRAYDTAAHLFIAQRNNRYGAVNVKNETVIPFDYESLEGFGAEGISRASAGGETFFLSKKNFRLGRYKYEDYGGYRQYIQKDTLGYVDRAGQTHPFPQYAAPNGGPFGSAGIKLVHNSAGLWGAINYRFELLVDTAYDKVEPLKEGYFAVQKGNRYGLVSVEGKTVVPVEADAISMAPDGNAVQVQKGGTTRLVPVKALQWPLPTK